MTHWYFGLPLCEEYAMGDSVIDHTNGQPGQVDCQECLEWMHS